MKTLSAITLILLAAIGVHQVRASFDTTVFQPQAVYSGVNATTTSIAAYVLQAQDVVGYSTIIVTASTTPITLTLPASSTLSTWLPIAGQRINMFILNASSSPISGVGIVAGTGSLLENASSTATTTFGKAMELDVMRKPNSDLLWSIVPFI